MTTLIVQLPPRPAAEDVTSEPFGALPFMLFDRHACVLRTGHAALALLPRAHTTILLIAARDILFLNVPLAPLPKTRLRAALPNVVEDQLLQDAHYCHIALEPLPVRAAASNSNPADLHTRRLAVIDRNWFQSLYTAFTEAGHLRLRAVPLTSCFLNAEADDDASAWHVLVDHFNTTESHPFCVELSLVRDTHAEGLSVPIDALTDTLAALTLDAPFTLYQLNTTLEPASAFLPEALKARPLSFETLARAALRCRFNLCQFEFTAPIWRMPRGVLKRWRIPLIFLAASTLTTIIGAHLSWLSLARQREALIAQQTETLLLAFPKTASVLDAPRQMRRQLDKLRIQVGETAPEDFLSLAQRLARALGPTHEHRIERLEYRNRTLEVTFKSHLTLDAAFRQRLADHGLSGQAEGRKWILRSIN